MTLRKKLVLTLKISLKKKPLSVDLLTATKKTFTHFGPIFHLFQSFSITAQKWSFLRRIFSVNLTKSAENCGFGHIYRRNLNGKLNFLCSGHSVAFATLCWKAVKWKGTLTRNGLQGNLICSTFLLTEKHPLVEQENCVYSIKTILHQNWTEWNLWKTAFKNF